VGEMGEPEGGIEDGVGHGVQASRQGESIKTKRGMGLLGLFYSVNV
jgi:hypothetical protein